MQTIRTVNRYKWGVASVALGMFIIVLSTGCVRYVGTLGAGVYHVPDCKYAEQSLDKYGRIKRVNYHTTLHKDLSGRKPCPKCIE